MKLMDSDICIDILREHPPAIEWFAGLTEIPSIPGFCAVELLVGAQNRREMDTIRRFLARFHIVWPHEADMQRGLTEFAPLHLSHGLSALNALIAGTAVGCGAVLLTFNGRHFQAVSGLIVEQPYTR